MRLDAFLAEKYPAQSRSTWAKLIRRGDVRVNGAVVVDISKNVESSDDIVVAKPVDGKVELDLPVIYEDENVIVINKPAGVLTHSKGALNEEFTVADFITTHSDLYKDSPCNDRAGIVHRLDRGTSGVIIGAKNETTRKMLQKQFQDRKTKKTYLAVVNITTLGQKTLDKNGAEFTIDLPIARNPKKPSQFKVDGKGKPAITDVKVVQVSGDGTALLELKPLTGRTHQLRVHLSHIGLPIVGDPVYNAAASLRGKAEAIQSGSSRFARDDNNSVAGLNLIRMMLHARELEITIPEGQRKVFTAELPDEFAKY
jgi:23S rRNA pseudouridine1911/1915/1917 synthase